MPRPTASGWRSLYRRFAFRLVAAMLLVSLPLMIVLAVLLTTKASASLTTAGQRKRKRDNDPRQHRTHGSFLLCMHDMVCKPVAGKSGD